MISPYEVQLQESATIGSSHLFQTNFSPSAWDSMNCTAHPDPATPLTANTQRGALLVSINARYQQTYQNEQTKGPALQRLQIINRVALCNWLMLRVTILGHFLCSHKWGWTSMVNSPWELGAPHWNRLQIPPWCSRVPRLIWKEFFIDLKIVAIECTNTAFHMALFLHLCVHSASLLYSHFFLA